MGVVSPRSHTQRSELVFLGRVWGVSHESGAFGLVSTHTGEGLLHFPLSGRPPSWAFIVASFINGLRNPGPSTSPLRLLHVFFPPPGPAPGKSRSPRTATLTFRKYEEIFQTWRATCAHQAPTQPGLRSHTFSVHLKFLLDHSLSLPSGSSKCSEFNIYSLINVSSFVINICILT